MSIPIEKINQIPPLYAELKTKKKVAEQLGISVATVSKYLNLFEAGAQQVQAKKTKVSVELITQINEIYKETKNMAETARRLNVSTTTVKNHLSKENLELKDKINDDRDALFFYIYRLFGQYNNDTPVNPWNIVQMQKFKAQGIPYRAQLLTLKYFYEIKHNSIEKSNGSIGIIPWVLADSQNYYEKEVRRAQELNEAIQRQLEKDRIEIPYNPSDYIGRRKKKKPIDLNTIGE